MSTRATYQIEDITFYCHWDGCPSGAAERFAKMIDAYAKPGDMNRDIMADVRGGLPFAFIRGNLDAEPCRGHSDHGDTEWRYTLAQDADGKLTVAYKSRVYDSNLTQWKTYGPLDVADFINQQRGAAADSDWVFRSKNRESGHVISKLVCQLDALEAIPVIVRMAIERDYGMGNRTTYFYATLENARQIKHLAATHAAKYGADNPNKESYLKQMRAWARATQEGDALLHEGGLHHGLELRAMWDEKKVPRDRQDAMMAEIEAKAGPHSLANLLIDQRPN